MSSRLQLTEAALVTDAAIQKEICGYEITTLIFPKKKLNDIIKNY